MSKNKKINILDKRPQMGMTNGSNVIRPYVSRPIMQRPFPISAPARGPIQLQPIIQPIAIVAYSSQDQAVEQYADSDNSYDYNSYDGDNYDSDNYDIDEKCVKTKKFNAMKLLTFLFGLITIAILVLGKFITFKNFLYIQGTLSGFEIVKGITAISGLGFMDKLPIILLTAGAALLAILTLGSLFSMNKGTGAFSKVIAILMALCILGFGVLAFLDKSIAIGGYIVAGCSLLVAIFALAGKKR
ncbi:MAG: hypothetical protein WCR54_04350 [Clostridia bacterium]